MRKNANGTITLMLDIYYEGKRIYERLGHLQLAKPSNMKDREYNKEMPVSVYSRDLMKQAIISAVGTYYKCIRDLKVAGYIRYIPSYNPLLGSLIYFWNDRDEILYRAERAEFLIVPFFCVESNYIIVYWPDLSNVVWCYVAAFGKLGFKIHTPFYLAWKLLQSLLCKDRYPPESGWINKSEIYNL